MNIPSITLLAKHTRIDTPEGFEPADRYFRLTIDRQQLLNGARAVPGPRSQDGQSPQYFFYLHISLSRNGNGSDTFAFIDMGQFALSPPKTPGEDIFFQIHDPLAGQEFTLVKFKVKKLTKVRSDQWWPFLEIGDEIYDESSELSYEDEEQDESASSRFVRSQGIEIWPVRDPKPSWLQFVFLKDTGELDSIITRDPAPFCNLSAGIRYSPKSKDEIFVRILYKHPARKDQGQNYTYEAGDLIAEIPITLRPVKNITQGRWLDDGGSDIIIEGIPVIIRKRPGPDPKAVAKISERFRYGKTPAAVESNVQGTPFPRKSKNRLRTSISSQTA